MTVSWKFYADAGLTVELNPTHFANAAGGSAQNFPVYYGSPVDGKKLQRGSSPGTDPVTVSIDDTASGSGLAASVITQALTAGALDTNTPGAPLALGATLLSGISGAVPVFLRGHAPAAAIGTYADLRFAVLDVIESDA